MSGQAEREKRLVKLASRARCKTSVPADEIARGAHYCWSNAVSLLADVRVLVSQSRYARALSLTILALEELAKPPLLWGLDPKDDPKKWKSFWAERFSRHPTKQNTIAAYGSLTGLRQNIYWFTMHPDIVKALDTWKQWGFYVDCVDNKFQSPDLFASEQREIVDLLFAMAEERADSFAQFHSSPESSLFAYEHRLRNLKAIRPGEFWPPAVRSSNELHAVLLSLASQYSSPPVPIYDAFLDGCTDLKSTAGEQLFHEALWATGRVCCSRARFDALPTACARGLFMLKLCLSTVPETDRSVALREWEPN
jgi:AbiV family abortive infection protein